MRKGRERFWSVMFHLGLVLVVRVTGHEGVFYTHISYEEVLFRPARRSWTSGTRRRTRSAASATSTRGARASGGASRCVLSIPSPNPNPVKACNLLYLEGTPKQHLCHHWEEPCVVVQVIPGRCGLGVRCQHVLRPAACTP